MKERIKQFCVREPEGFNLKKLANSQGMTVTGMLLFALREFCEKRNIDYKNLQD